MSEKGDALRAMAKAIDAQEKERESFLATKAAYQQNPTDKNRDAYRAAARKYDDLRSKAREVAVAVPTDGRSMTVVPPTVGAR